MLVCGIRITIRKVLSSQSDHNVILSPETIVINLLFLTQNVGWGGGMLVGGRGLPRGLWESGLQASVDHLGFSFQF